MLRLCILGCLLALATPSSFAQGAQLYCANDEALVRFNDAPLPAGDKSRWANAKPVKGNRCTLTNGTSIVVRSQQAQATPWGMGGADPEFVFSFWVNGKKVIEREMLRQHGGYPQNGSMMNHVLYAPGSLSMCRYPQGAMVVSQTADVRCERRKVNLSTYSADPLEPFDDTAIGKITVSSSTNPAFCESFVARNGARPDVGAYGNLINLGRETVVDSLIVGGSGQSVPLKEEPSAVEILKDSVTSITLAHFDFLNTGKTQTVLHLVGWHRMMSGSYFVVHDGVATEEEVQRVAKILRTTDALELEAKAGGEWRLVRSRADDYTYHEVVIISGVTFALAMPFWEGDGPDAIVYKMSSDYRAFWPVCTFQGIKPNL